MPADLSMLGTPVEVGAIARELKKLWAADQTRTRATLFNFAIICDGEKGLQENSELLARFVGSHAFRAILIGIEPAQAETKVQAWINANCYLPKAGAKHVCSEQVSILVKGDARALLANLLFQQLDYDLPLTLWWRGGNLDQVHPEIWRWVDRLVYDSQCWSSPKDNLAILRKYAEEQRAVLCDLAWTRTLHLRQSLAQMFDTTEHVGALQRLERVIITHAPGARMTADLLLSWLAAQLEWKPASQQNGTLTFRHGNGVVTCDMQQKEGASISEVSLKSGALEIVAKRSPGTDFLHIEVREADGRAVQHLMPGDCDDLASVLDEELASWGKHRVYEKALAVAAELF